MHPEDRHALSCAETALLDYLPEEQAKQRAHEIVDGELLARALRVTEDSKWADDMNVVRLGWERARQFRHRAEDVRKALEETPCPSC